MPLFFGRLFVITLSELSHGLLPRMNNGLVKYFISDVSAASATFLKGQVKINYMPILSSVYGRFIGWLQIGDCVGWDIVVTRLRPRGYPDDAPAVWLVDI